MNRMSTDAIQGRTIVLKQLKCIASEAKTSFGLNRTRKEYLKRISLLPVPGAMLFDRLLCITRITLGKIGSFLKIQGFRACIGFYSLEVLNFIARQVYRIVGKPVPMSLHYQELSGICRSRKDSRITTNE